MSDHLQHSVHLITVGTLSRVSAGDCFTSLSLEFRVGESTFLDLDKLFWLWFHDQYLEDYVTVQSRVGFDNLTSIEWQEQVFRQMVLPGFITCMDVIHFLWDRVPYQIQVFVKEGTEEAGLKGKSTRTFLDSVGVVHVFWVLFERASPSISTWRSTVRSESIRETIGSSSMLRSKVDTQDCCLGEDISDLRFEMGV